ncbi:MAG TPA: S8 family serine peptidase, partial [Chroococcales cyanobacterium]
SADSSVARSEMVNTKFVVKAGTSMATPFTAGLVALLLQRDPTLEPDVLKELLQENSSIPGKEPGTFDNKWGYGLIDAANL